MDKNIRSNLNYFMVYIKAREAYSGPKKGRSTDLHPEMLLGLHSMGMREFNGVLVDDNFEMLKDKDDPDFFEEFMEADEEKDEDDDLENLEDDLEDEEWDDDDDDDDDGR